MLKRIFILIVICCSCKSTGHIYFPPIEARLSVKDCGYFGNTELTFEKFEKSKEFSFIGYYAIDNYGKKTDLRIKECSEYYPNGKLKSRGKYEIGSYIQCCASGPCEQYNNYKVGKWEYYFSNGQLMANCQYQTENFYIQTSCGEGDSIKFNTIKILEVFDEGGIKTDPTSSQIIYLNSVASGGSLVSINPENPDQIITVENNAVDSL